MTLAGCLIELDCPLVQSASASRAASRASSLSSTEGARLSCLITALSSALRDSSAFQRVANDGRAAVLPSRLDEEDAAAVNEERRFRHDLGSDDESLRVRASADCEPAPDVLRRRGDVGNALVGQWSSAAGNDVELRLCRVSEESRTGAAGLLAVSSS